MKDKSKEDFHQPFDFRAHKYGCYVNKFYISARRNLLCCDAMETTLMVPPDGVLFTTIEALRVMIHRSL